MKLSSLSLPPEQDVIEDVKPLIDGFGEGFVTERLGGYGLEY